MPITLPVSPVSARATNNHYRHRCPGLLQHPLFLDLCKLGRQPTAQAQVGIGIVALHSSVIIGHNVVHLGGAAP